MGAGAGVAAAGFGADASDPGPSAQAPAASAPSVSAVRNRFLVDFMEFQSSPFEFAVDHTSRNNEQQRPLSKVDSQLASFTLRPALPGVLRPTVIITIKLLVI